MKKQNKGRAFDILTLVGFIVSLLITIGCEIAKRHTESPDKRSYLTVTIWISIPIFFITGIWGAMRVGKGSLPPASDSLSASFCAQ